LGRVDDGDREAGVRQGSGQRRPVRAGRLHGDEDGDRRVAGGQQAPLERGVARRRLVDGDGPAGGAAGRHPGGGGGGGDVDADEEAIGGRRGGRLGQGRDP
jgi:hypothetical protein